MAKKPRKLSIVKLIERAQKKTGLGYRTLHPVLVEHGCPCSWETLARWGRGARSPSAMAEVILRKALEEIIKKAEGGKVFREPTVA